MTGSDAPGQWSRVLPLLDEALELEPAQREAWLAALACRDALLAAHLHELLALHAANRASGFMERSPIATDDDLAGGQIGPYAIERLLGRGGMGSVWLGRRNDGKFEGRAAIKVLDRRGLGGDAAQQIRREASLLARLSHAHIARLFDAGVRENGQPYLILEYVEGEPIDCYCRNRSLPLAARLRLFVTVLDAVAHAHAHLIVHRDLKPSNVLVTPEGVVKLLDFGVASLQAGAQTGETEAPRALTPGYAAPEQLRGEPVAAAGDVYALGALLYVLVTGEHPFGARGTTETALMRAALTEDPEPASGRLAGAAERRHVRGDLDAIIARALSRDAARRYATAAEFAEDVRAYLGNFPVRARSATRSYVAHKFAQRHWGGVLSVVLTLLVLLAASVVTTLQTVEARRQRDFARRQLARAEALNDLDDYLLTDAAPAGKPFTVNELMGRAARMLERQHSSDTNRVVLLTSLGWRFITQDENQTGLRLLDQSYQLSRRAPEPEVRARTACAFGAALSQSSNTDRAAILLAEGLQELPAGGEFALDRSFCLLRAADIAMDTGDPQVSIRRAQEAIEALTQVPFEHELADLRARADLAEAYRTAGRCREAIAVFNRIWPQLVALGRDDTITAVTWLNNWGIALGQLGRPLEGERLLRRSIEIHRIDASDAAVSPMVMTNYAEQLFELERLTEAQNYAERAYAAALQAGDDLVVNQTLLRRARIYREQGDYGRATAMLDQVEPRLRKDLPPGHYAFGVLASERSLIAQQQGDTQRALKLANQALDNHERAAKQGKSGAQFLPVLLTRRASVEADARQLAAAERDSREALQLLQAEAQPGDFSNITGRAYLTLARTLDAEGRTAEARSVAVRAAEQLLKAVGAEHPDTRAALELSRMR